MTGPVKCFLSLALPLALSGCYAGAAGVALGVLSLSDDGGGGSDALPQVTQFRVSHPADWPDIVQVEFELANDDQGHLEARVEYVTLDGETLPGGPSRRATPGAHSDSLEDISPLETVRFLWDAEKDLEGHSAWVEISVTPLEDGVEGRPFRSDAIRAGNTPVVIRNVNLASREDFINVSFELVDKESDPITLVGLELCLGGLDDCSKDGARFVPLPDEIFRELPENMRENLPSRPEGALSSLTFPTSGLDTVEELQPLALAGFAGDVCARVLGHDFEGEGVSRSTTGCFYFSNNRPPVAQILPPVPERALSNGVIPIRFRLFDADENPADVEVWVDFGDGPRRANEFPVRASSGTSGLEARPVGAREERFYTFLWDALSQSAGQGVAMYLVPRDAEEGVATPDLPIQLALGPVEPADNIWLCSDSTLRSFAYWTSRTLVSGDFDDNGFLDLVTLNYFCGEISYIPGGPGGLEAARVKNIEVGEGPWAPYTYTAAGDLDNDRYLDLLVPNLVSGTVTYLRGGPDGLSSPGATIDVGGYPPNVTTGDFDRDGHLDTVVPHWGHPEPSRESDGGLTYLKGPWDANGPTGGRREFPLPGQPMSAVTGDFNGDGYLDLVVASLRVGMVYVLRGGPQGLGSPQGLRVPGGRWGPLAVVSEDFDRDGHLDVLASWTSIDGSSVTWLRGGDGGLSEDRKVEIRTHASQSTFALTGDFNGDGFPDAAVSHEQAGTVTLLSGKEGLRPGPPIWVGELPWGAQRTISTGMVFPTFSRPTGVLAPRTWRTSVGGGTD